MFYLRLILRGFLCLLVGLCVWEVCARIDDALTDGAPFFGSYKLESMLMTSDQFGMTGKPYAHYQRWTLNSRGNRGPEFRSDRERVICMGASETFGLGESPDMEYPRQLERVMNARVGCDRYQVVNIAHPGQTLLNFSRRTNKVAADFRPQIATIYPSPIFYFYGAAFDANEVAQIKHASGLEPRVWTKVYSLLDNMPDWAEAMRYEHHIRNATRNATLVERIPDSELERFQQDLSVLLDHLEQNHIQPVLITHANRFGKRVLPNDRLAFLQWRNNLPMLDDPGFLDIENRANDVVRKVAALRNIPLVDAAGKLSGRENFVDYAHFTDRGSHIMADLIADKLLALDESQPSGCKRTSSP